MADDTSPENDVSADPAGVTNKSLTGDEFARAIRERKLQRGSGFLITGKVDLTGLTIEDPLTIRHTTFTDEVNFSQIRFKRGVDLTGCLFAKELIFADARVEGSLSLDDVIIGKEENPLQEIEVLRLQLSRLTKGWSQKEIFLHEPQADRPAGAERRQQTLLRLEARLRQAEERRKNRTAGARFDNLRVEGRLSMAKIRVFGDFSCNHAQIESDLILEQALIEGHLLLRHSKLGELRNDSHIFVNADTQQPPVKQTTGCVIGGDLDLDSAAISGDVFLVGITIGGQLRLQAADVNGSFVCRADATRRSRLRKGAWLLAARVKGNVDFSGARLHGDLVLEVANIGGSLQCTKAGKWSFMIDGNVSAANVRIAADTNWIGSHIRGDFSGLGAKIENSAYMHLAQFYREVVLNNVSTKGNLVFTGAHIYGSLLLENAVVGGGLFFVASNWLPRNYRCQIDKKLWLLGIMVTGDIDLSGARLGDDLIMQNVNVGENVRARIIEGFALEIEGVTYLNGSRIRGTLELAGATLKDELVADGVSVDGEFLITYDFDDLENWKVVRSQFAKIHMESGTIGKAVVLAGLTVGVPHSEAEASTLLVSFVGVQINGQFSLYSQDHVDQMLVAKQAGFGARQISPEFEREVRKKAFAELAEIYGDLSLTRAQILGGVVLDGATIHGDLDLRDATIKANINCKPIKIGGRSARVSLQRADLEALDMTGDVDMTGLNITGKGEEEKDGDLILRNARIRGRLELCPFSDESNPPSAHVSSTPISSIRGDLRLDAAEISHVTVSGLTFGPETEDVQQRRLAALGTWLKPLFFGGTDEEDRKIRFGLERGRVGRLQIVEPLPGTLDLSNLKVDRWSLPEDQTSYERMLRNSYPFKRSNYLAIESTLRNEGLEERADEINVSMRRRDRQSTKSLWKIWFESFLDVSIKYGTTSKRLACVMVALFALSVWIFANPNHVEYSISPAAQKPPPVEHPAPAEWGLRQSGFFAVRLNVPIVSLGIDEKVQASGFWLKLFGAGVMGASWIMWPLLIASLSGFIRKRN